MTGQFRPTESEWGNVRRIFHDVATLAARIGVGGIFFANGWDKLEAGLNATTAQFAQQGAPLPNVWAAVAMLVELLGGAMLIAGFAVPICGILLFVEALAVFIVASGDPGQPLTGGDTNLIVALGSASILLAVVGAGRASVDHMVVIKRRDADDVPAADPDAEADAMLAALREPRPPALGTGSPDAAADPGSTAGRRPSSPGAASTAASGTTSGTTSGSTSGAAPGGTSAATSASASKTAARRARDAEGKDAPPAGEGAAAESTAKTRRPRRRTDPESPAASPSEAPPTAEKGDKLVAGRREGTAD